MGFFANLCDALWKPSLTDPVSGTAQVVSSTMQAEQVADRVNASGQAIGEEAATDGANRLRHLQVLRDDGLISEAEYQTKRADILSGL